MQGSQIHSRNDKSGARARNSVSRARPWYKRALGGLLLWRQPTAVDAPATTNGKRPLWRSSLKAAVYAVAPRRVMARSPIGRSSRETLPAGEWGEAPWSTFRGRTLKEHLLMRRFVQEEEATRRRMVMEVAAKRYGRMWLPPPASRLSVMSLADDDGNAENEAGESVSSSIRCSKDQPL